MVGASIYLHDAMDSSNRHVRVAARAAGVQATVPTPAALVGWVAFSRSPHTASARRYLRPPPLVAGIGDSHGQRTLRPGLRC